MTALLTQPIATRHFPYGVSMPQGATRHMAPLTLPAMALVAQLHRAFQPRRKQLLAARAERHSAWDSGTLPRYTSQQSEAVCGHWQVAPIPADLTCRRVEITGPVNSAKMVINMLSRNSQGDRADCAMVDFEDSMKPSWANVIDGVENVIAAINGRLTHIEPAREGCQEKIYRLNTDDMAKLMVRVRGLHLNESNFLVDGEPVAAGLFDLVITAFHTAAFQVEQGLTPKYYVPKIEHHEEARWWDDLLAKLETSLCLPLSAIRATFLIETLPAAFQIEEILFELRDHVVALNVGRWDKIFSDIKTLKYHPDRIMADRSSIGLNRDWMSNYARRLIRICHKHGAYALGGMAAFTPGRDPRRREEQTQKVAVDKALEASWGHDGCWVSHPYFIGVARAAFTSDHQCDVIPDERFQYPDLLPRAEGPKTEAGLRINIRVGIAYMYGWQQHIGCIAWDDLMEDLATLEISRAQVWQWLHHRVTLDDGRVVEPKWVTLLFSEELVRILAETDDSDADNWRRAEKTARELFLSETFREFLSFESDPEPDQNE